MIFPVAARMATSALACGATTVICAPARSREAIFEVASAPAPTTRHGRFSSLMNAGNNSEGIFSLQLRAGPVRREDRALPGRRWRQLVERGVRRRNGARNRRGDFRLYRAWRD